MQVSRAGFYRHWQDHAPSEEETALRDRLQQLAIAHRHYGYRRLTQMLKREGFAVNGKRILRMMQEDNLLSVRKRGFVKTTQNNGFPCFPNLLPHVNVAGPDEVWVADITYLRLREELCFLAVVLDAYSRRVVGWAMRRTITADLTAQALTMALQQRRPAPGWIHHSDRGAQYNAADYLDLIEKHGGVSSMSRAGNPYDNAQCESFMATLKREQVEGRQYRRMEEASVDIGTFIERIYNQERLHSALGYQSPAEFEAAWPSNGKIRQVQARLKATLAAGVPPGLDPDPASPNGNHDQGQAGNELA